MSLPRFMIAACSSGSGKTTITCAMLQTLLDMEKEPVAFKCGPDYIDPMFHKNVLGISSKNLDPYFTDSTMTKAIFAESMSAGKIGVIEGVMGVYDGLGGITEEASSYHLASMLQCPIILVMNVKGMGRSVLAQLHGFLAYDREHLIKGVILNRISPSLYVGMKEEIEKSLPIHVFGYFPDQKEGILESRHLGLKMPGEVSNLNSHIQKNADQLKKTVDVLGICQAASEAEEFQTASVSELLGINPSLKQRKIPIGVAIDEAFCFYYEDNLKLLNELGAELIPFSPLRDSVLPKGLKGMLLGGGYPELYAQALSDNVTMRASIAHAIQMGMPSIAECGGFLYLHKTMEKEDLDGERKSIPLVGVIDGSCHNARKLVRFGYVSIEEKEESFLGTREKIKGHEFHYYDSSVNGEDCIARKPIGTRNWDCIQKGRNHWWGFPHLYYYSNHHYVMHFLEQCSNYLE